MRLHLVRLILAAALAIAQAASANADAVRAVASTRGDSGRLTLNWPRPIAFEATSSGGRFVLRFERPAEADFAGAATVLRRFVGAPSVESEGRTVSFPLRTGIVALTLADGKRVVIDLFAPTAEAGAEAGDAAGRRPEEAAAPARRAVAMRPVPAPNRGTGEPPTPLQAASESRTGPGEPEEAASAEARASPASLRFDWTEPVAAVVFRRAGALWIVFDRPSNQDLAALQRSAGAAIAGLEQRPHANATVLRMTLDKAVEPVVRRDALSWIIGLEPEPASPSPAVAPVQREGPDGRRSLALPVAEPGAPLAVTDPALGDSLVLVPTVPLDGALRRAYAYPQFRLLATAQGFVIRPLVDDLQVRAGREGVEVEREDGLALTPVGDADGARARLRALADDERPIGLGVGSASSVETFIRVRQGLEAAVAASSGPEAREHLYLRLARHDLAYGFAAEALAAVNASGRDRPEAAGEAPFLLLRAAALVLHGRDAEAAHDLAQPSHGDRVEAAAWRTASLVAQGQPIADGSTLAAQAAVAATYPRALRKVLLPRLAEAAIDAGDPSLAARLVNAVAADAIGPGETAEAGYLEGRRLAANGDVDGALETWRAVAVGPDPDRRNRVRAAQARVALALAEKRMQPDEAIDRLDRLSFAWRGDLLEFAVLRQLGGLYLDRADYPSALRTLRRAATNFPDAARAADIPAKMSQAFAALFVGAHADRLRPIEAIALYDEFRELTPAGAEGDAVIAAVAERMIGLDLLGRAAALLDSQIRYRLAGVARGAVGARLATVYLLDNKPGAALKALGLTADEALPVPLKNERRIIEARALARLGREKEALARLEGTATAEVAAIRADIFWAMKDWRQAAASIARALATPAADRGTGPAASKPRRDDESRAETTFHLAVALALAGEEAELARLGKARSRQMAQSRWRDVFPLITAKTMASADPEALAQGLALDLAPVDRFRQYLMRPSEPPM
ncbi:MAG: tetratricopeptide repeat protein [Rhodospirillales bacterium]|nr:tetratricopeptide repeat protein [Rhodospirillales bacterium]